MNKFCLDILEEKPVISFDELLLLKYEIDNSEIDQPSRIP
jgi:hypothetical protein